MSDSTPSPSFSPKLGIHIGILIALSALSLLLFLLLGGR